MPSSGWRWRRKRNTAQGAPNAEYRSRNAGSGRPSGPSCQAGKRTPRLTPSNPSSSPRRRFWFTASRESPRRSAIASEESMSDPARDSAAAAAAAPRVYARLSAARATTGASSRSTASSSVQRRSGLRLGRAKPFYNAEARSALHVAGSNLRVSVRPVRAAAPARRVDPVNQPTLTFRHAWSGFRRLDRTLTDPAASLLRLCGRVPSCLNGQSVALSSFRSSALSRRSLVQTPAALFLCGCGAVSIGPRRTRRQLR